MPRMTVRCIRARKHLVAGPLPSFALLLHPLFPAGTCAALAATGFRGRQTVVGIDLGTTYSVIGVNEARTFNTS